MIKAIQGSLTSTLDLEWYEAREDSLKLAIARRNLDLIKNGGNSPLIPGLSNNGGHR